MPRVRRAARAARCSSRRSRSSASRSGRSLVAGIGCYTTFSGTIDVDLVQALHGRAPSVATGVKRMRPDARRVHAPGRRRHGERGAPGGAAHRGAGRDGHLHPAEQRRVRRDRRAHDRDERARPAHEELARRPRRRVPRLPDPDRRPRRRGSGRGVRRPRVGAQRRARWPGRRRCPARVRDQVRGEGFSFVEVLTMCPTGWFIPTAEGPDYMHETLGEVHVMGELKVDGVVQTTEELHDENVRKQREVEAQLARRRPRPTRRTVLGLHVPARGGGVPDEFRAWLDAHLHRRAAGRWTGGSTASSTTAELASAPGLEPRRSPTPATPRSRGPRSTAGAARASWSRSCTPRRCTGPARRGTLNLDRALEHRAGDHRRTAPRSRSDRCSPAMLRGDDIWCQGFSEPDAGSDLASLRDARRCATATTASSTVRRRGTRSATSRTGASCSCAPTPTAPKHKGITCLLVDMTLPGVEVRPLVDDHRRREFNEIFFTDVRVPRRRAARRR